MIEKVTNPTKIVTDKQVLKEFVDAYNPEGTH